MSLPLYEALAAVAATGAEHDAGGLQRLRTMKCCIILCRMRKARAAKSGQVSAVASLSRTAHKTMITSLSIRNFKRIDELHLPELKPVTLLAGKNNTGKSTVLEAIFFLWAVTSPDVFFKLNMFRMKGLVVGTEDLWGNLFTRLGGSHFCSPCKNNC